MIIDLLCNKTPFRLEREYSIDSHESPPLHNGTPINRKKKEKENRNLCLFLALWVKDHLPKAYSLYNSQHNIILPYYIIYYVTN